MYELICGSIFDKKCDVIIIPCNHLGGISREVNEELNRFDIQNIPLVESPGSVIFERSIGGFTNASVIGFAASVNSFTNKSNNDYLHNICKDIKKFCKMNSLSLVNIPLLGAGAGGLSREESFAILKEEFEDETAVTMRVFVLSNNVYFDLKYEREEKNKISNPRVFISYAGKDPENKKWVKEFICKLRQNGVNARADIFHLKPGQDLPQWMTNEVLMADKVLLICDKFYMEKADTRKGGVGWESMIIQGDMMADLLSNKYICIVREEDLNEGLPLYVKTKLSLHWTEWEIPEDEFRKLLYCLFDCDLAPEIGEIPADIRNMKTRA